MTSPTQTNWRLLEAEIIDILRREGVYIDEQTASGDKFICLFDAGCDINLTAFSRSLADRVTLNTKVVQVKDHALVNGGLEADRKGIHAKCVCGWSSGGHYSSLAASAAFMDHKEECGK